MTEGENSTTGVAVESGRALTFGEKAVGLTFNPSGDETVLKIKQAYADIIDILHNARLVAQTTEKARHLSIAITDAETAQMRAVKGVTFNS